MAAIYKLVGKTTAFPHLLQVCLHPLGWFVSYLHNEQIRLIHMVTIVLF